MIRLLKSIQGIAIAVALAPAEAHADDKDALAYRKHIMSTLNEQSAALGMILSGAVPDDNFVVHLEVIALAAKTALKAFEPKVQGGEAKPEVWTNWPDFSKRMNEFAQDSDRIAQLARDKGQDAAVPVIMDALPCKSCHDIYRNEKN
jgi:cytochrome c556